MSAADQPARSGVSGTPVVNPANALTALRLVLVPLFLWFVVASAMTESPWRFAAGATFVLASLTDFVDGWIARRFALVTAFGKVADPIADKALTGTALVLLSWYDRLPWWVTVVILVREFGITLLRLWLLRGRPATGPVGARGPAGPVRDGVIAVSRGGKVKTALQILAIGWYLFPLPPGLAGIGPWIMAAALAVTAVTGLDYALRALRLRRAVTHPG